ncbi:MAG: hypothetical protein ACK40M_02820 [Flavobacteriales bacterium]
MKRSSSLFQLIKTLTPQEKSFFKKYFKGSEQKKFILLFDTISKMDIEDDILLTKKLKGIAFKDQLSGAKNYLFHQILDVLSLYKKEDFSDKKLLNIILHSDILIRKGLYKEAKKNLEKGIRLCLEFEKLSYLPILENKILRTQLLSINLDQDHEEQNLFPEKFMSAVEEESKILRRFLYLRTTAISDLPLNEKTLLLDSMDEESINQKSFIAEFYSISNNYII